MVIIWLRRLPASLLVWLVVLAAIFATADTLTSSVDTATLISLIWGVVSIFIFKVLPTKDGPMILISYLAPIGVVALAVLVVDGTAGWSWQKYAIDVLVAYGANQGLFNGATVVAPNLVK
jgi:TRAP-type C4-dicarboxylate transport system permease small subunit